MFKDKGILKAIWVGMFILCGVLGFVQSSDTATSILLTILSVLFFAAPYADLYFSQQRGDRAEIRLIRNISMVSLGGTTVLLLGNLLSVLTASLVLGDVLYYALAVVSVPMLCGGSWFWSLLLWAGLLWGSMSALRKFKK